MLEREQFVKILKEKGLKLTTQRIIVLETISSCPGKHFTAEEIYDLAREKYPEIGLATIYRTVQLLLDLNVIDKINFDDGLVRYEIGHDLKQANSHHHHHVICKNCGIVYAFEDDLLEELEQKISEQLGFEVLNHEVKLYGICAKCRKKTENN